MLTFSYKKHKVCIFFYLVHYVNYYRFSISHSYIIYTFYIYIIHTSLGGWEYVIDMIKLYVRVVFVFMFVDIFEKLGIFKQKQLLLIARRVAH